VSDRATHVARPLCRCGIESWQALEVTAIVGMDCGVGDGVDPPGSLAPVHDRHECEIGPLLRDSHERLLAVQHVDDLIVSRGA
jgi:hypothetical protein